MHCLHNRAYTTTIALAIDTVVYPIIRILDSSTSLVPTAVCDLQSIVGGACNLQLVITNSSWHIELWPCGDAVSYHNRPF